jgi:hypothetical protein
MPTSPADGEQSTRRRAGDGDGASDDDSSIDDEAILDSTSTSIVGGGERYARIRIARVPRCVVLTRHVLWRRSLLQRPVRVHVVHVLAGVL